MMYFDMRDARLRRWRSAGAGQIQMQRHAKYFHTDRLLLRPIIQASLNNILKEFVLHEVDLKMSANKFHNFIISSNINRLLPRDALGDRDIIIIIFIYLPRMRQKI